MGSVKIRSYKSPHTVLLAYDWDEGTNRKDFLGFAIRRTPGFYKEQTSWLPNRICFDGPSENGKDYPSNKCPIQKFMWWDARINTEDQGHILKYVVTPVCGKPSDLLLLDDESSAIEVEIPPNERNGIGTYFNRAVISSQAFKKKFETVDDQNRLEALSWLANGLEKVIPRFISDSDAIEGAIYHFTDGNWVIPAFKEYGKRASIVYHWKESTKKTEGDHENESALEILKDKVEFNKRTKTALMHNKFLIGFKKGVPVSLLMGSSNFTPEGLTIQANLLHTFRSPELAKLYLARKRLLQDDPEISKITKYGSWSVPINLQDAKLKVFFSPESGKSRASIDEITERVKHARQSILFCLFCPTDKILRDEIFKKADSGKMMFGLINSISPPKENQKPNTGTSAKVEIFHRSRDHRDVYSYSSFQKGSEPFKFWWEIKSLSRKILDPSALKKGHSPPTVHVHHKFIVIDGETKDPVIFTGSANISENSTHRNDENLIALSGCSEIADIYVAEFLRLYEHYRARAVYNQYATGTRKFELRKTSSWAKKYYQTGSPEYKSRVNMVLNN